MSKENEGRPGHAGENQPWREARHQPEPEAIEGLHDGQRIPEEKQRHPAADTQVGLASRPAGDHLQSDDDESAGGLASGSHFSDGGNSQGSTSQGPRRPGSRHATGEGRSTEGAFAEQEPDRNANPFNDFRDAGISKNELGPSGYDNRAPHADRTQGGDQ